MRTYIGFLVLIGAALLFSGCAERYYGRGYYGPHGYSNRDHHDRWHDQDRYGYHHGDNDRR